MDEVVGLGLLDNTQPFDEDATALHFGEEFQNAQPLFLSEVKVLMEAQKNNKPPHQSNTDVFDKTLQHCSRFNRIAKTDTIKDIRRALAKTTLDPFEMAQIVTLNVDDVGECKAIIPSVTSGIDDAELYKILVEVASIKRFQL
ncbi:hypothetical protein K502DRAFT_350888 [Neoconidiobolus thromboides FSU 785]|nr:hypothetical protein K502DRAFT_350888 [Neoconidiobolus thromboides FSU 785]